MKIFFDTEFIEDGRTIDLISIGLVREDGKEYYAESAEYDPSQASSWVRENVFPNLTRRVQYRAAIAQEIVEFVGDKPEFWGYYADYDWVVLCQLYGTMMDLPKGWPRYCLDIKQLANSMGDPTLPKQSGTKHNAINDAIWNFEVWKCLQGLKP